LGGLVWRAAYAFRTPPRFPYGGPLLHRTFSAPGLDYPNKPKI